MDKQWDRQTDSGTGSGTDGNVAREKQDAFADVPSRRCDWMDDYDGARRYRRVGEAGTEPGRKG